MNRRRSRWARWFGPSPARAAAGLVLACLVALTACTGDGTDSNADSSSASPSGAVAEAHGAPDLEELLPDELDGLVLTTASYRGDAVTEVVGFDSTMLEAMLADVGATMDDLSLAVAGDEAGTVLVAAIRVDGVPGEQVVDFFVRDMEEFGFEERTVEGKRVTTTGGGGIYFYAADDVMFEILGEASLAEEAIAQLP